MKMHRSWIAVLLVVATASWLTVGLAGADDEAEKTFDLVGVKKCKMCHGKKTGDQYGIWEAGSHAKAFETLASEAALAEAKKHDIADPQKAPECLSCHATAFAVMGMEDQSITMEEGVSCESCHGPGSEYKSLKVKKGIKAGTVDPASVGLVTPDEAVCLTCHKEEGNAFFKEFNFEERVKKIAHPIPEAEE